MPSPCICTLFQVFDLFLNQNLPGMFQRKLVLQISKCDLSSNQKLFASFQTKFKRKQKRKRQKIGKLLKGRGAALRPEIGSGPRPVLPLFPNRYRFSSLQPLTEGPHLSSLLKSLGRTWCAPGRSPWIPIRFCFKP
jgi:hypothetical protein